MLPLAAARRRHSVKRPPEPPHAHLCAVRRRYGTKLPPRGPDQAALASGVAAALRAELALADGLQPLALDARRRHVHYVHYRTQGPEDVQPDALTRQALWKHLVKCYREVFPREGAVHGSTLLFGLVASERHADSPKEEDRSVHHHAIVFTDDQHLWKKIRKLSAEKYRIHLHAVAHDCYTTMYQYLRAPTPRKPLSELDPDPYYSPGHPKGAKLKELLERGEKYIGLRGKKRPRAEAQKQLPSDAKAPRSQFGTVYTWVLEHGLRGAVGATQFHLDAAREWSEGRAHLLEFAKRCGDALEDQLEFIWHVSEAPSRLVRLGRPREELLAAAAWLDAPVEASTAGCSNGTGTCRSMYDNILQHQGIDAAEFCHLIYNALRYGRRKGNAVMLVGGPDTGKTTMTLPAGHIFKTMDTPQADSFCPLEGIRGHELMLWQDFRYAPGHPKKDEQGMRLDEGTFNRLLEGLPTRIGVPKTDGNRRDFVFTENPAFIFTGPFSLTAYRHGRPDLKETEQLAVRVQYVFFNRQSLPTAGLCRGFKPCPLCWSRWILLGELGWRARNNGEQDDIMDATRAFAAARGHAIHSRPVNVSGSAASADAAPNAFMEDLRSLVQWRESGALSEAEFARAKARLGF